MTEYEFFLTDSLEKVFPARRPRELQGSLSLWGGTRGAVQLVYRRTDRQGAMPQQYFRVQVLGGPAPCRIRKVALIPSEFPCYAETDPYYITTEPGLFPDLLEPMEGDEILPIPMQYRSLWLSWELPEEAQPGAYGVTVRITPVIRRKNDSGLLYEDPKVAHLAWDLPLTIHVGKRPLPEQSLIHTEWFHGDCLANYYGTEMYDDRHWQILENFIRAARRHGVNMLLTPVLTPPLDTPVGGIRRISQLVKIFRDGGTYRFDFSNLERWVGLCRKYGIRYLEIAHLFTQWGAEFTPNVMATVDGEEQRIFGWNHRPDGEYRAFLQALLPALRERLIHLGYDRDHVWFHVSDEPSQRSLPVYQANRELVKDLIPEDRIMDALSSVEFYRRGIVPHPIAATTEAEDFREVPDLWVYYCCAQCRDVPNRFFAQESACTRMMGVLMYLYQIRGFLHWGFNFYNSKFSGHPIDPYRDSHADFGFPSGDPFLVYPGPDGDALDSLRAEVQDEGLLDLRALQWLEQLAGRDRVTALIYEDIPKESITFQSYPRDPRWLLRLREKVAAEIDRFL